MDSVQLIVAALAAGVLKGAGETASAAVADAYQLLKNALAGRIAGNPAAELVVAKHADDPETWEAPLTAVLRETGVGGDDDVVLAARKLLDLADSSDAQPKQIVVDAKGSNIGAIGDHAQQHNNFGAPPAGN